MSTETPPFQTPSNFISEVLFSLDLPTGPYSPSLTPVFLFLNLPILGTSLGCHPWLPSKSQFLHL